MTTKQFTYQTYLPVEQRYLPFITFDGRTHLTIGKYIQNNDDKGVNEMFMEMISSCCQSEINVNKLTNADLFCILLNMRIMSVSQTFDFESVVETSHEKVKKTLKLDLYDILDKVTNHNLGYITNIAITDDYSIDLGAPVGFKTSDFDTLVIKLLKSIHINGEIYDLTDLKQNEKIKILDELPGTALNTIISHISKIDHHYRIKVFENVNDDNLSNIELKLFDNSMFEFIKAMYNCNLQEQYYIRYIMVKRLGFLLSDIDEITPIDTQNYINLYKEELEEEKKAQEKSSGQSKSSMTLPNPGQEQ
jgi:hypothetical protein